MKKIGCSQLLMSETVVYFCPLLQDNTRVMHGHIICLSKNSALLPMLLGCFQTEGSNIVMMVANDQSF